MKLTISKKLILTATCLAAANAFGGVVACNTLTTLSDYIGTGATGCDVGDKNFSNFAFLFQGGTSNGSVPTPLLPAATEVDVVTSVVGNNYSVLFDFASATDHASVSFFQNMDLQIQYVVSVTAANWDITSINGSVTGAFQAGSNASATFTKRSCDQGFDIAAGNAATGNCLDFSDQTVTVLSSNATPLSTDDPDLLVNQNTKNHTKTGYDDTLIGVYDHVVLNGGSNCTPLVDCTSAFQASVSSVSNTFNQTFDPPPGTPEPATMALLGSALIGLGVFGRKRFARR